MTWIIGFEDPSDKELKKGIEGQAFYEKLWTYFMFKVSFCKQLFFDSIIEIIRI